MQIHIQYSIFKVRAIDNYLGPWIVICINALIACLLSEVFGIRMPEENLQHWDTVSLYILTTTTQQPKIEPRFRL